MPPKKTTVSRKANAQKGAKVSEVTPQLETDVSDLHSELESANIVILSLRASLAENTSLCESLSTQLEACQNNSVWLSDDLDRLREKYQKLYREVKEHSHISAEATKALAKLQDRHAFITERIMGSMRNLEEHMQEKVGVVKQNLKESSKVIATLRKAQKSSSSRQERASKVGYIITAVFQSAGVETVGK
ncbi:hypothetical protein BYT27DRAFT_7217520, partial [Phlegmacium glaucopus]